MNRLPNHKRIQILKMLCEGSSLGFVSRSEEVSIHTVKKLLMEAGSECAAYHDAIVRDIKCRRMTCSEIWSFCRMKEGDVSGEQDGQTGNGDVYTWTAIDSDTKLIVSWSVGKRNAESATSLLHDVLSRLNNRVQLTTYNDKINLLAQGEDSRSEIDFSQLLSLYGFYPQCGEIGPRMTNSSEKHIIRDNAYQRVIQCNVERQNSSVRIYMHQFERLTNRFYEKLRYHFSALSLYFMFYNFFQVHKDLNVTPAMAAGLANSPLNFEYLTSSMDKQTTNQYSR